MNEQQRHEMVLEITHASGAEEWNCPTCGRRLLIKWEPEFKKTILQTGDEFSIHSGGKGGLRIGRAQVMPVNDPTLDGEPRTTNDDPRLAPWEAWMDKSDFEDLWNDEDE
jgi:DNA-directed RNA polymerase subunit RPC12/RpoP